jgi:hypothetical protein
MKSRACWVLVAVGLSYAWIERAPGQDALAVVTKEDGIRLGMEVDLAASYNHVQDVLDPKGR